jgi:hypothetical protein
MWRGFVTTAASLRKKNVMSSFATSVSRTADKDPQNGKPQIHLLTDPDETPALDAPRVEPAAASSSQTIDEVSRVERLLSQLEARSLALVPYGYGALREVPARKASSGLIAGTLVAIWLSTIVLAVAYIRYTNRSPAERAAVTAPMVIANEPDPQEQRVANSVDHLAKALISSSQRLNELQAAMDRSNRDLQRIAKANTTKGKATLAPAKSEAGESALSTALAEGKIPKNWHRVLDMKPTESATAHKTADGSIDYWLVPRGVDSAPSKVLPIGTSSEGVVVHSLEDGKDYTLTPAGEWRSGSLTPPGN